MVAQVICLAPALARFVLKVALALGFVQLVRLVIMTTNVHPTRARTGIASVLAIHTAAALAMFAMITASARVCVQLENHMTRTLTACWTSVQMVFVLVYPIPTATLAKFVLIKELGRGYVPLVNCVRRTLDICQTFACNLMSMSVLVDLILIAILASFVLNSLHVRGHMCVWWANCVPRTPIVFWASAWMMFVLLAYLTLIVANAKKALWVSALL